MFDTTLIAFAIAAAALTIAPGADTMLVMRNVLRGGRRDGVLTTLGICSGLFVHASLSALGMSVLLTYSATAFSVVKWVGATYLVYLGITSIYSALSKGDEEQPIHANLPTHNRVTIAQCLREGFLSNVLNPKTAVFYLAFLPQFINPSDPVLAKSLLLATIHFFEGIIWLIALSLLFDLLRRVILHSAVRRWLDGICGAILISFGIRLALEKS